MPRFLTTAVSGLWNLTNSVVDNVGDAAKQNSTISAGATKALCGCRILELDTEASAATDNLDTINYTGSIGDIMRVVAENSARTVVVKDGTGNLNLNGDFALDNVQDAILLQWNGTSWDELSRSDNGT